MQGISLLSESILVPKPSQLFNFMYSVAPWTVYSVPYFGLTLEGHITAINVENLIGPSG
jgi:hypothetical protein